MKMKIKCFYLLSFLMLGSMFTSFTPDPKRSENDGKFLVVLDAGHGGHDPGNLGNGYLEKNIALNIVLKVGALLEKNPNIKVIYTRKDDTFIDLYKRGEIANKADADLFVSVHCDSHSSDAHGAGTFVLGLHANKQNFEIAKKENSVIYLEDNYEARYAAYDINSPESVIGLTIMQEEFLDQSIALAKLMQDNFAGSLKRNDRKVKQAGFIVLHQTFMPSVLVETGFLTNKEEGAYLNSAKGQTEMADAIAKAILKYKTEMIADIGVPPTDAVAVAVQNEPKITPVEVVPEKTEDLPVPAVPSEIPKKGTKEESPVEEQKTMLPASKAVVAEKESAPATTKLLNEDKNSGIAFKVQLMASSKDLSLTSGDFKGLNQLSKEPFNNLYRYMYGSANTYNEAKMLKSNADLKGFAASYIVAYKDGVRIPLQEALKYVTE